MVVFCLSAGSSRLENDERDLSLSALIPTLRRWKFMANFPVIHIFPEEENLSQTGSLDGGRLASAEPGAVGSLECCLGSAEPALAGESPGALGVGGPAWLGERFTAPGPAGCLVNTLAAAVVVFSVQS